MVEAIGLNQGFEPALLLASSMLLEFRLTANIDELACLPKRSNRRVLSVGIESNVRFSFPNTSRVLFDIGGVNIDTVADSGLDRADGSRDDLRTTLAVRRLDLKPCALAEGEMEVVPIVIGQPFNLWFDRNGERDGWFLVLDLVGYWITNDTT